MCKEELDSVCMEMSCWCAKAATNCHCLLEATLIPPEVVNEHCHVAASGGSSLRPTSLPIPSQETGFY